MYYYSRFWREFFTILLVGIGILILATVVVTIISWWKIFTKAGEKGWKSLIPIYSGYVLIKNIARKSTIFYWIIVGFSMFGGVFTGRFYVSINSFFLVIMGFLYAVFWVGFPVYYVLIILSVAKNFGKSTAFAFGLMFLPVVFYPLLAFGNSKFINPILDAENDEDEYEYIYEEDEEEEV